MQAVLIGVFYSFLLSLGLAVILGFSLYFTSLSSSLLPLLSSIIVALAVFWGGLQAARTASAKRLIQGLAVGLLFFIVILSISWSVGDIVVKVAGKKLGICILAGAMGGIAALASR